jgi:hypothetical protein
MLGIRLGHVGLLLANQNAAYESPASRRFRPGEIVPQTG